ncbi:ribosome recycling factor [Haloimpatiens sp. FM7330]|uniref:ribosome recycling factor n=1 Tax=Haloimpatiens sp. FM7330 TaxID=3298610 RepID=UPI0036256DB7
MKNELVKSLNDKMQKTVETLKKEMGSLKAGRANPSMLDRIQVEYYGTMTPLSQMANISAPEPRILLIQPWDKGSMKEIEKAILISDLGLNPSNDGSAIRLLIPELTEETRKKLVKTVKKMGEDSKVAVRNIRKDGNDKVKRAKKENTLTEDDARDLENKIQKEVDKFVKEVDKIVEEKEKDLMSV